MTTRRGNQTMVLLLCLTFGASTARGSGGTTPPFPPSNLRAVAGNNRIAVNFSAPGSGTVVRLYWGTSPGVSTASPNFVDSLTSPAYITGLANGTRYYVMGISKNSYGDSNPSVEVSATPAQNIHPLPPTGVHAQANSGQVTIGWNPVIDAETFNLYYRNTAPGVTKSNGTSVGSVDSPVTVSGLTNNTCYYIVVTSLNSGYESAESAEICVTPIP
jgi:hypothetical protein